MTEEHARTHALTVDVEDYFQVLNMQGHVSRAEWNDIPLRCGDSTRRLLELLARHEARATFFFLGWVAERLPDLVREVHAAGHEIGSHGYDHRVLGELGEDGFRADLARTEDILGDLTGAAPRVFRACTWSVVAATRWAIPALIERGYTVDSSVFPIRHPDYGVPGAPVSPYRLQAEDAEILEFPPLTLESLGRRLPVGGGGYLRLFPLRLLRAGLRQQRRRGWPGCLYVHPWEVDPEQPRYRLGGLRGFRHYVNLRRTLPKLERLLGDYRFVGVEEALTSSASCRDKWPAIRASELFG